MVKSQTKNRKFKNSKTLKKRINKYICRKEDICCEEDFDRDLIIEQIFKIYKQLYSREDEYLDWLNNDIVKFIGYKMDLESKKDVEGVQIWDDISNTMMQNKRVSLRNTILLLKNIPLYFLLSFLGVAYYTNDKIHL